DLKDPIYLAAKNEGVLAVKSAAEALFAPQKLDAIFYPSALQAAGLIKSGGGGGGSGGDVATSIVNESGFPEIVVPAGFTADGLPLTISFMGKAYSEPKILGYAYDFEQLAGARRLPKTTPVLAADTITY